MSSQESDPVGAFNLLEEVVADGSALATRKNDLADMATKVLRHHGELILCGENPTNPTSHYLIQGIMPVTIEQTGSYIALRHNLSEQAAVELVSLPGGQPSDLRDADGKNRRALFHNRDRDPRLHVANVPNPSAKVLDGIEELLDHLSASLPTVTDEVNEFLRLQTLPGADYHNRLKMRPGDIYNLRTEERY